MKVKNRNDIRNERASLQITLYGHLAVATILKNYEMFS